MRQIYEISDETRAVLTDKVIPIAAEMDVNTSYLYQILSGVGTDCFSKFRRLYSACVRAGADVTPWDASLSAIKTKNCVGLTETQCLVQKIERDADTTARLVDALKDGLIDERERTAIGRAIQKERDSLDVLEAFLSFSTNGNGILPKEIQQAARARKR